MPPDAPTDRLLTEAELVAWGRTVGARVTAPAFIGLEGPLGAGKSVLARAIGAGAGVQEPMPSPSYNLRFEYPASGGRTVVHMDLYRLESPAQLAELGWEELGAPGQIVLVEWPERAGERLPADRWTVRLTPGSGDPRRRSVAAERLGDAPHLPSPSASGSVVSGSRPR